MPLRILWISILVFPCIYLSAQTGSWKADDFPGSQFIKLVEKDNKLYAIVSNLQENGLHIETYKTEVYEVLIPNFGSDVVVEKVNTIPNSIGFISINADYFDINRTWLFMQYSQINEEEITCRAIRYNNEFEIIDSQSITTYGWEPVFQVDSDSDDYLVLGSLVISPENKFLLLNGNHAKSMPPIDLLSSDPANIWFVTSMDVDSESKLMALYCYGGIAIVDTNLSQVTIYNPYETGTYRHGSIISLNGNYFSHGSAFQSGRTIVLQSYNSTFTAIKSDTFGIPGRDNYPFIKESLITRNNEILCGGHLAGPLDYADFPSAKKKFYVAKYDMDLNLMWYKEFGGDQGYIINGLYLMDNGSSFVYGYVTDSLDGNRYAYLLYLDQNGNIVGTHQEPENFSSIKVVNPGSENLIVFNQDNVMQTEISLFSLDGKELFHSILGSDTQEFPLDGLPQGIYPYVLTQGGRHIDSGKWIKQK